MDFRGQIDGIRGIGKHSGSWISCEILAWIAECACLDVRIFGPKQNLFQPWSFSNEGHLNSRVCCLLCYLYEINNGIHIYQFAFERLHAAVSTKVVPHNMQCRLVLWVERVWR